MKSNISLFEAYKKPTFQDIPKKPTHVIPEENLGRNEAVSLETFKEAQHLKKHDPNSKAFRSSTYSISVSCTMAKSSSSNQLSIKEQLSIIDLIHLVQEDSHHTSTWKKKRVDSWWFEAKNILKPKICCVNWRTKKRTSRMTRKELYSCESIRNSCRAFKLWTVRVQSFKTIQNWNHFNFIGRKTLCCHSVERSALKVT